MHIPIIYPNGIREGFYFMRAVLEQHGGLLTAEPTDEGILYVMDDGTLTVSSLKWQDIVCQYYLWCDSIGIVPF